jgi:hypothetical protein
MIGTEIKLKAILDFLKDNLSLIIVIPAFLGGLWQSIELMSISIPYIRFFSISQIVPDGLLILSIILIGLVPYTLSYYYNYLLNLDEKEKPKSEEEIESDRIKNLKRFKWIFFISFFFGVTYFLFFINFINTSKDLFADTAITIVVLFGSTFSLHACYELSDIYAKKIYKLGNLMLIGLYILTLVYYRKILHNSFVLTDNLDNVENINNILNTKYPNKSTKIEYFNDKYLFIKIIDSSKKDLKTLKPIEKIHIMEIEKLLND